MLLYKFIQKRAWYLVSAIYTIIVLCYCNTPVFWDMYIQVKTAHYFLDTSFTDLFPNTNGFIDNGYFPIYTVYLALLFKFFGFKLWVAHISVIPFVIGFLYQLQLFCRRYLSPEKTLFVLMLTLIHPAIEAQSIYFSSEICFVFLGLYMLNAIKDERASRIALSSTLLCLLNFRALPFVILVWLYFTFIKKQKSAWYLFFSVLVSIVWLFVHRNISGWFFENPATIEYRSLLGFTGMVKNLFWCLVKLTDFANIIALVFIGLFCINHKKIDEPIVFVLLAASSILLFSVPISNPINNRYFLLLYVLAIPAFVFSISTYSTKKMAILSVVFVLFLVQSSRLIKPNKYGNAWDCTLQSLDYFDVRKEFDNYVTENNIALKDVAAGFQVYFNDAYYLMNDSTKEYDLLSDTEMNSNLYIADSNICNNYSLQRKIYLEKNYTLVKSFEKGTIYIHLYKKNRI